MKRRMTRAVGPGAGAAFFLAARVANAFCGFYVSGADAKLFKDATRVAPMRDGTRAFEHLDRMAYRLGCSLSETQERNGPLRLLAGIAAKLGIFVLRRRRAT